MELKTKKKHFYSFNLLNHVIFCKNILTGCSHYYDYDDDGYYLDMTGWAFMWNEIEIRGNCGRRVQWQLLKGELVEGSCVRY